jgi:hypothetical protein
LQVIPSIQRQVFDLLVIDHGANGGIRGLQQRHRRLDVDRFSNLPDFKHRIQLTHVADLQNQVALVKDFESRRLNADCVFTDPKRRRAKLTALVRAYFRDTVGCHVRQRDGSSGNRSP